MLRKTFIKGITAALFLSTLAANAYATTYYVDSTSASANDKNAGTSQNLPLRSLAKISGHVFKPGDTIALKAGSTFTGGLQIVSKGTASLPITFKSYGTGARPVIKSDPTYGSYNDAVYMAGARYVTITGLKVMSASNAGIVVDAKSSNNLFTNNEAQAVGIGFQVLGKANKFTGNFVHDGVMVVNTKGGDDDYGANGFVIAGTDNEFAQNRCYHCKAPSYDYGFDGGMFEIFNTADNTYIHHNWSEDSVGFLEAGGSGKSSARNVRVQFNVSKNDGEFICIHFTGGFGYTGPASFDISNNTVVDLTSSNPGALNYIDTVPAGSSVVFKNNLVVLNKIGSVFKNDITRNNNLYYFMQKTTHVMNNWANTLHAGEMIKNPLLVNLTGGDYHLTAKSPAIGAGLPVSKALVYDIAGKLINQAHPSIGAYQ